MPGRIVHINISKGGLPKTPIDTRSIEVGPLGLKGDEHRFRMHGGPAKAVLLVAAEVVDTLSAEGWPLFYGALGENFTVRGLNHREWRSGMRFATGTVLIRLTEPRQPCSALDPYGKGIQRRIFDNKVKSLDPTSPHWGESGFYAAVIVPGTLAVGDSIAPANRSGNLPGRGI